MISSTSIPHACLSDNWPRGCALYGGGPVKGHLEQHGGCPMDVLLSPCKCSGCAKNGNFDCSLEGCNGLPDAVCGEDDLIDWAISHAASTMALSISEQCALKVVLYKNYIRSYETLKLALEAEKVEQVLHPIVVDHLERAVFETESIISLQNHHDAPPQIPNPTSFRHGAIFIHRLLPLSKQRARVVCTFALNVSTGVPLIFLYNRVGALLNLSPSHLRFFLPGGRVLPSDGVVDLTPSDAVCRTAVSLPAILPLGTHGLSYGASIFCLPLLPYDPEGIRLHRYTKQFSETNKILGLTDTEVVALPILLQTELETFLKVIDRETQRGHIVDPIAYRFLANQPKVPSMSKMHEFADAAEAVMLPAPPAPMRVRVNGRLAREQKHPCQIKLRKVTQPDSTISNTSEEVTSDVSLSDFTSDGTNSRTDTTQSMPE